MCLKMDDLIEIKYIHKQIFKVYQNGFICKTLSQVIWKWDSRLNSEHKVI